MSRSKPRPHPTGKAFHKAILHRLVGRDGGPFDLYSADHFMIAFEVSSVPLSSTIISGLPRRSISAVSFRATRWPKIDVSGIAARHSAASSAWRSRPPAPSAAWPRTPSPGTLSLPSIERALRHPMLAAEISALRPRLEILQHADDLLFSQSCLLNRPSSPGTGFSSQMVEKSRERSLCLDRACASACVGRYSKVT